MRSGEDNQLVEPLLDDNNSSKSIKDDLVTPYSSAGLFSVLTFSWMSSLIELGNRKALDFADVPKLDSMDSVFATYPIFRSKLVESNSDGVATRVSAMSLVKALFLSAWRDIFLTGLLSMAYTLASYVGPYLIGEFVHCLSGQGKFRNQGYLLALAFLVAKLVERISYRCSFFKLKQIGMRMRSVIVTLIYRKGLTVSSFQENTSGQKINLLTIDAQQIESCGADIHEPWMVILQFGLALFLLYENLGLSFLAALGGTCVLMLVQYPLGKLYTNFNEKLMEAKDQRIKATSEVLRNLRIIKFQAWDLKFLSKIMELRKTEEAWLKKALYTSAFTTFVYWCSPILVSVASFSTCVLLRIPLDSARILSALATFGMLNNSLSSIPSLISMIAQTKVSLSRISHFLSLDDLRTDVVHEITRNSSSDIAVEITDGCFSWDITAPNPTIRDISLRVRRSMRVAVCGTVGCGKSTLLSCILGEVPKISGSVELCGTKAYVAQSPWIQSGTIEENILFGKEMDRGRYEKILEACALEKDLEILPLGDQTIIGERGINLSGGQKQRIQIARALYQDADIYLFDDTFSAVDAHTGSHLFKEVLLGLLSTKTVVYITHQIEFVHAADLILVMKDGRITQAGKYDDILNSGPDFMELVGAHDMALSTLGDFGREGISNSEEDILEEEDMKPSDDEIAPKEEGGQIVKEEERGKGQVGFQVYWKYLTTVYRGAMVPLILFLHLLYQILLISSNYWMAEVAPSSSADDADAKKIGYNIIAVYVTLSFASAVCILFRSILLETAGYKAATILFNKMHSCIFRAPMSFFDGTPSGRILNRCSADQSEVDENISYRVYLVAFLMINLLGTIAVMSQAAWQVFVIFIPAISTCLWYQNYYIPSARELSRLVGTCNAPVIQHFSETISGVITIRSFGQQLRFQKLNMKLNDAYSQLKFHSAGAVEWLGFRLDMFSCITFAFCLFFLIRFSEGINPAIAGLAVTYGLGLNMAQAKVIWSICNLEYAMISVERILQFVSIPSEAPLIIDDENTPDPSWPSHGEVNIANLQMRYAPHLPLVLRGLTCTFSGGKKIGIVGRTGSGKSSLIQTLFRIVEPAAGHIVIDGINTSAVGLHDLRSRLSIIPQDPTMFEGTIRSNLDPLESYTNMEIWEVLDKCQLGDQVRKKENGLDSIVTEKGENWSLGQRQLICLGRVLLKKSKVLVLDEATSSVDTATDNFIQQTIQQHFSDSTVITIAHRITSILNSDMVLLLGRGVVEEYDSPNRLLANKASLFTKLVTEYTESHKRRASRTKESLLP
ncbi:hypothetical protein DM860_015904 [Cuscuta australis]|uniref:ABC-type xenobiotic transporter n=1 Tax=Cuscuta australis TaxID=267555 RepID=A0A328DYE3_9ASTE|nr:hypothetical protein DM860_015904 [Cuscuta australis]